MIFSTSSGFLMLATCAVLMAFTLRNGAAEPVKQAVAILRDGSTAERRQAAETLAQIGDQGAIEPLAKALHDPDALVRDHAEQALWLIWHRSGNADIDALLHQGIVAMQRGALERAVEVFSEVIRRDPDFAEGYNKRATAYYLMQEYEQSIADCERTMTLNPVHFGALSGAGLCYLGLRNPGKALEYFERAIAVNPNMPQIRQYIQDIQKFLRDQST